MALFRIQDDKIQNMDLPREFNAVRICPYIEVKCEKYV